MARLPPRSPATSVLIKGSRSVGMETIAAELTSRARRGGGRLTMGEILIAGMASMLICIFLGPKFIEYLRVREFGQHIREDGPQEHHAKAGTPTMGGLIIFAAICVPYLVLSERDASSLAVFGVAHRLRGAGLRRRLHQDHQTALARALRALQAARPAGPRLRPLVGRPPLGRARTAALLPDRRRQRLPRPGPLLRARLPGHRRHLERGQPDRRPRRPRRRLLRDRPAHLHGDRLRRLRPAGPGAARLLPGRRLHRIPLVQRLPGLDLHGGHRLASASAGRSGRWR